MSADDPALLVVDDNDDNRYTLTRRLAREGYRNLTTATNGREANRTHLYSLSQDTVVNGGELKLKKRPIDGQKLAPRTTVVHGGGAWRKPHCPSNALLFIGQFELE